MAPAEDTVAPAEDTLCKEFSEKEQHGKIYRVTVRAYCTCRWCTLVCNVLVTSVPVVDSNHSLTNCVGLQMFHRRFTAYKPIELTIILTEQTVDNYKMGKLRKERVVQRGRRTKSDGKKMNQHSYNPHT